MCAGCVGLKCRHRRQTRFLKMPNSMTPGGRYPSFPLLSQEFVLSRRTFAAGPARPTRATQGRVLEKRRLLKAGHKERLQPSLFDSGPNTGDDRFLTEIQIHENSDAIGDRELGTEGPTD